MKQQVSSLFSILKLSSLRANSLSIFSRISSLGTPFLSRSNQASSIWGKCFLSVATSLLLILVGIILATPGVALPACDSAQVHDVAFKLLQQDMHSRGVNTDGLKLQSFQQMNVHRLSATCQFTVQLAGQEATMYATIEGMQKDATFELSIFPAAQHQYQ